MKKRMSLQDKAYAALKKAVRQVVQQHKKNRSSSRGVGKWQGSPHFSLHG
ncbi:MAG: hypothetical protein Q7J72_10210 [Candidatus Omnitrophota bacterium]|nr:hypothetical protein [Candidatus Omnitrophota bacterium]